MNAFIPKEFILMKAGYLNIAGMDEAGRGPLAGPVVCAAVIFKNGCKVKGVDDSKKLTAKKREKLFWEILDSCTDYSICAISHTTIDEINILNAVRLGNKYCIDALKIKPDFVLIDGRDKQIIQTPHECIIKGDSKVKSIAAASILAKVFRDKLMEKYAEEYKIYEFEKHKGYGTRQHRSLIIKHGFCEIHRKTFSVKAV
jgi:ribonuclease HII